MSSAENSRLGGVGADAGPFVYRGGGGGGGGVSYGQVFPPGHGVMQVPDEEALRRAWMALLERNAPAYQYGETFRGRGL